LIAERLLREKRERRQVAGPVGGVRTTPQPALRFPRRDDRRLRRIF
jgi:hypothetical protein